MNKFFAKMLIVALCVTQVGFVAATAPVAKPSVSMVAKVKGAVSSAASSAQDFVVGNASKFAALVKANPKTSAAVAAAVVVAAAAYKYCKKETKKSSVRA